MNFKFNHISGLLLIGLSFFLMSSCSTTYGFKKNQIPEIKQDVAYLASDALEGRLIGTEGERLAAEYIVTRFEQIGLTAKGDGRSFLQKFSVKPVVHAHGSIQDSSEIHGLNVVGMIDNKKDKTVIIGAHYDHLGYGEYGGSLYIGTDKQIHNGADDNASGVSALLALAERIKLRKRSKYNYIFIAFSGEEEGLWGSNHFAKNPTLDLDNASFMINMDMVGRLDTAHRMAVYGTGTSSVWDKVMEEIKEPVFKIKKHESGMGPSDHTSFYLTDLPVLHFFTGQHEDYHKPTDDEHLINYEGIKLVVDYIDQLIHRMDKKSYPDFIKTKDESSNKMKSFKVTLGVMPDYLYSGVGLKFDGVKIGRPAFVAGLKKGDIVLKMGDLEINDMSAYMEALNKFEKGQTIKVTVLRGDVKIEKDLTFQ